MKAEPLDLSPANAALKSYRYVFDVFAQMLIEQNRTDNLTRVDSAEEIWTRHFVDSLAALPVLDEAAAAARGSFTVIDVGSGAGFPGLALAIARPNWQVVSLEATEKKARFQRLVCQLLGLVNAEVRHGRAETLAREATLRQRFDAVTARALAPLNVLVELTMGFVRPGGMGVFWKGPQVQEEITAAAAAFEKMAVSVPRLSAYTLPDSTDTTFYLAVADKLGDTPEAYPRANFAAIKKRPLGSR